MTIYQIFPIISSLIALSYAFYLHKKTGTRVPVYFKQYRVVAAVTLLITFLIILFLKPLIALGFLVGAFSCVLIQILNSRVSTGFLAAGLSLLIMSILYILFQDLSCLIGFGFGASLIPAFSKVENVAADLFGTHALIITSAIILGSLTLRNFRGANNIDLETASIFPLILGGISLLASIVGSFFTRQRLVATAIFSAIAFYPAFYFSFKGLDTLALYLCGLIGIVAGLAVNARSNFSLILTIVGTLFLSYQFAGTYGVAIAAAGMLFMATAVVATKATTYAYTLGIVALTSLILFFSFSEELQNIGRIIRFDLTDPKVLVGVLIGGSIPYIFTFFYDKVTNATLPVLLPILAPVLVGKFLGAGGVGGMLIGIVVTGVLANISVTRINPMIKTIGSVALLIVGSVI